MSFVTARRWVAGLSMVASIAAPAKAQSVFISAVTTGCFYNIATPLVCNAAPILFSGGGTLAFSGNSFSGTTSGGSLSGLNLGLFTLLGPAPIDVNSPDWRFQLTTVFTAPSGIAGGASASFASNLTGAITANRRGHSTGALNVVWTNPTRTFAYTNTSESGTFTYRIPDLNSTTVLVENPAGMNLNSTPTSRTLTGEITNASFVAENVGIVGVSVVATPEPATAGLVALGLVGVAAVRRRRRKA